MNLSSIDLTVFVGYILCMVGFGIYISRKSANETAQDYFLASRSLPWWAVGGSLIASNISTEQILGMNGSGYAIGMAIASYELLAAVTLLLVAKFFLPIFLEKGIYSMPQFLEERFDGRVRTLMAVFWVLLFVFVNITSILYLGGLAIQSIMGVPMLVGIIGLVLYSASFSIFGGLKAVVWTDVVQVIVLIIGGTMASVMVTSVVGGGSFFTGLSTLVEKVPEKFDMIFEKDSQYLDIVSGQMKSAYDLLPGISVLIGGMWIANIYYWGNNQYIIQRALASKNIAEAQRGVAFAAFLKIFMPLIVVIPGIAAYVILNDPETYNYSGAGISKPDEAFPWVLNNFVTTGFKGLTFAALVAAIGSSISSMVNSVSTIFTLDIYKPLINKTGADKHYVTVGRISAGVALLIGAMVAPVLGNLEQVLQFIQEWTGFISPGVVAVFIFGLFWRKATANAAFAAILLAIPLSAILKIYYPSLPFLDRMGFNFLALSAVIVGISMLEQKGEDLASEDSNFKWGIIASLMAISVPAGFKGILENPSGSANFFFGIFILILAIAVIATLLRERKAADKKGISIDAGLFKTDAIFNISSIIVVIILTIIYYVYW